MARRKKRESGLDLLLAAPWWIAAGFGAFGFAAFQWIIPAATADSPFLKGFGLGFKPFAYFAAAICGLIALVNYFRQRGKAPSLQSTTWNAPPPPLPTATPHTDALAAACEELSARGRPIETVPTELSLNLLRLIEWKRFEEICSALYGELRLSL